MTRRPSRVACAAEAKAMFLAMCNFLGATVEASQGEPWLSQHTHMALPTITLAKRTKRVSSAFKYDAMEEASGQQGVKMSMRQLLQARHSLEGKELAKKQRGAIKPKKTQGASKKAATWWQSNMEKYIETARNIPQVKKGIVGVTLDGKRAGKNTRAHDRSEVAFGADVLVVAPAGSMVAKHVLELSVVCVLCLTLDVLATVE